MDTQIQGFTYRSPLLDVISKLCLNPNNSEGQIILVVGPPGSGKTVFLSQLYGILKNEVEFITAIKAEISDEEQDANNDGIHPRSEWNEGGEARLYPKCMMGMHAWSL